MATYQPSWTHRRRVVFGTLIFCAGAIAYLIAFGEDIRLHEAIADGLILLAASVIGGYVFGAAWDDLNVMKHGRADQAAAPPQSPPNPAAPAPAAPTSVVPPADGTGEGPDRGPDREAVG
ncbi:hypothetical protein [Microbaculum marinisediminis]|uniref:Uncharacterized protein n=1 Tax=Microbaculum marinisediminis TaxID=2931392 RepID=A0AAW5QV77_9HYPH|nr:hypothetical protein [Microbaculum sp. A6E488]MCT8970568.1 hypothetical protein [Microbaculum sp. A6E488]